MSQLVPLSKLPPPDPSTRSRDRIQSKLPPPPPPPPSARLEPTERFVSSQPNSNSVIPAPKKASKKKLSSGTKSGLFMTALSIAGAGVAAVLGSPILAVTGAIVAGASLLVTADQHFNNGKGTDALAASQNQNQPSMAILSDGTMGFHVGNGMMANTDGSVAWAAGPYSVSPTEGVRFRYDIG